MSDTTSPSRRTRLQEKEQLQHLNDRFVTYIDHVKNIKESERANEARMQAYEEEIARVRRVYDRELEDARLLIDETAKEKARFQLQSSKNADKVAALENQVRELNDDYARSQEELAEIRLRLEECERTRGALNSRLAEGERRIRDLEGELEEPRTQVTTLQETLERETLIKVDLQNQIQSLKEELSFRKKLESDKPGVAPFKPSRYDDFYERLQAAIDDAREEIEKETEQYKHDLEKAHGAKITMLEKQISVDASTITKQSTEIRQLNASLAQANRTISGLQDDKDRLENALRSKDEDIAHIRERHSEQLAQAREELTAMTLNYNEKIKEYEELLDIRVRLEQEIATLSALLQEEENRLNISSTPTRDKRPKRKDRGGQEETDAPRAKRKKQVSATSSSSAGFIQICDVDPEGRYVQIKNMSDKFESLGGFKIVHEVESTGEKAEFKFHSKSKLQGGASVTVWAAGADDAVHNPPTDLIWKSTHNWGEGPKTLTSLISKNGEVVATLTQRKEVSMTETPSQNDIELDQTDTSSHHFPYIPESSPERVRQYTTTSTPVSGDIFHQQEDPVPTATPGDGRPGERNCVIC